MTRASLSAALRVVLLLLSLHAGAQDPPTGSVHDPATWHLLPAHGAPRPDGGAAVSPSMPQGLNEEWVVWIKATPETLAVYTNPPAGTNGLLAYDMKPENFTNATCHQSASLPPRGHGTGNLPYWQWNQEMSNGPVARNISRSGMCEVPSSVLINGVSIPTVETVPCVSHCTCPPQQCLVKDLTKPSNFSCTSVLYRHGEDIFYPTITRSNGTHTWQEKSPNATKVLSWGCRKVDEDPCSNCDKDITTCSPHCVRSLTEAEYFDSRCIATLLD